MSATSYGWLVLAFPLAGTLIISFGWLRGRRAGRNRAETGRKLYSDLHLGVSSAEEAAI